MTVTARGSSGLGRGLIRDRVRLKLSVGVRVWIQVRPIIRVRVMVNEGCVRLGFGLGSG